MQCGRPRLAGMKRQSPRATAQTEAAGYPSNEIAKTCNATLILATTIIQPMRKWIRLPLHVSKPHDHKTFKTQMHKRNFKEGNSFWGQSRSVIHFQAQSVIQDSRKEIVCPNMRPNRLRLKCLFSEHFKMHRHQAQHMIIWCV